MGPDVKTALYLMAIGLGSVFVALILLQALTNAIGSLDRLARRGGRSVPTPSPAPTEDCGEEEAAVIAAAVTAALDRRVEVHHIRMLHDEGMETWSRIGRLDIMRSHDRGAGKH